jgi:hypothetical protein
MTVLLLLLIFGVSKYRFTHLAVQYKAKEYLE